MTECQDLALYAKCRYRDFQSQATQQSGFKPKNSKLIQISSLLPQLLCSTKPTVFTVSHSVVFLSCIFALWLFRLILDLQLQLQLELQLKVY